MEAFDGPPKRIAYGDPPYPGTARRYYRHEPTYAGEVDHAELIAKLATFDGWALSTSENALQQVLALCPPGVSTAVWVKPRGTSSKARGPNNCWEPIIYMPARRRAPSFRDWLCTPSARGGGTLPGRKPRKFWQFLFQLLGMAPGDDFVDFFPGTGAGARHWQAVNGAPSRPSIGDEPSPLQPSDEPLLAAAAERKCLPVNVSPAR
jgi:hypothetical protein